MSNEEREMRGRDLLNRMENFAIVEAEGGLDAVKKLLKSQNLIAHYVDISYIEEALIYAVENGKLDIVQYLSTSPELPIHPSLTSQNDLLLKTAIKKGDIDIIEYFLSSPDLKENIVYDKDNKLPLFLAIHYQQLEVVEYLLNKFKDDPEFDDFKTTALLRACATNNLISVEYLLPADNPNKVQDEAISISCKCDSVDVLEYLIFSFNIKETNEFKNDYDIQSHEKAQNMLRLRELNQKLEKELNSDNISKKKLKL